MLQGNGFYKAILAYLFGCCYCASIELERSRLKRFSSELGTRVELGESANATGLLAETRLVYYLKFAMQLYGA